MFGFIKIKWLSWEEILKVSIIDLHIHSNNSDGTDDVETLLNKINLAGIKIFALCDHDTITGVQKINNMSINKNKNIPGFIRGIEFTCKTENFKCHILGLNYDENNIYFKRAIEAGENLRQNKFHERINFLRDEFKINFTDSEINELLKVPGVGKLHLGNLLVKKGLASTAFEAMEKFIDRIKTGHERLHASFIIDAILKAGGVPVWAHPLGGIRETEPDEATFKKNLNELISYGLKGLECYYSKYEFSKCKWLDGVARSKKLFISGGSDYHGANKKIPLGRLNADEKNINPENLTILENFNLNLNFS